MISRRLLRIKALLILYAYLKSESQSINTSEKELFFSIQKAYDLYHYLLTLIIDIVDFANSKIELNKQKKLASEKDLNPNTKFVNNRLVNQLRQNNQLNEFQKNSKITPVNSHEVIKNLYIQVIESDFYVNYQNGLESSYNEDKNLIISIYSEIIRNSDMLIQSLEEHSIYWNDDLDDVLLSVIKTIQKFDERKASNNLMPLFKNQEDHDFVKDLFRNVVLHEKEYRLLVDKYTQNWDVERIAFMDIIILLLAISEVITFPSIPIKVTLNEYIEIAKFYSTEKSSVFINGILDKIIVHLKEEHQIKKAGRGLM